LLWRGSNLGLDLKRIGWISVLENLHFFFYFILFFFFSIFFNFFSFFFKASYCMTVQINKIHKIKSICLLSYSLSLCFYVYSVSTTITDKSLTNEFKLGQSSYVFLKNSKRKSYLSFRKEERVKETKIPKLVWYRIKS
jgi:hypothetical protein